MGVSERAAGGRNIPLASPRQGVGASSPQRGAQASRCWCGAEPVEPLGSDYVLCAACGTVVCRLAFDAAEYTATDGSGFYDDRYWRQHVPAVLGLPGLEERARSDLPERAVFHLVKVLDHLPPTGRVLELGCGAGSLTYLLCQVGFDAEGLELGPAAIEVARDRFGVTVHRGPLETQDDPGPWDAIVAVDVLEHLPDPLATMKLCARRLAVAGRLFLQTPCYRQEGPEWPMLLPEEHLHLFTESSVERLLRAAGFSAVEVGGSLFAHDMWVSAAPEGPLSARPEPLAGVPPMVVALIDSYADGTRARGERDAVDADRERKQADVDRLRRELKSVRADQAAKARLLRRQDEELRAVRGEQGRRGELIERLATELATVRGDQAAKAALIERLGSDLGTVRGDQRAKSELITGLGSELEQTREDRAKKGRLIDRLTSELASARGDQATKEELIAALSTDLAKVRADQAAKEQAIERTGAELGSVRADQEAKEELIDRLNADLESMRGDQTAKAELIDRLNADLESMRGDQTAKAELIDRLNADLDSVRGDQTAKAELIDRLSTELATVRADQQAREVVIRQLEEELKATAAELEAIHSDRRVRLLQAVGVHLGGRR